MTTEQLFYEKLRKKAKLVPAFLLAGILILAGLAIAYYDILSMPGYQRVIAGEGLAVPATSRFAQALPAVSIVEPNQMQAVQALGEYQTLPEDEAESGGTYEVQIQAGGLPIKNVTVSEVEPQYLIVGGHSIGILLQTEGVTVVGHSAVIDENGTALYPAKDAGLKVGDFVTDINGMVINTNDQIRDLIDELGQTGQDCIIHYMRDGTAREMTVKPLYCSDSQSWRIGLYVRDNTAGVGTLTFYDPQSGIYGALGHMVSDLEYGVEDEEKGTIVRAAIQGIKSGAKGAPGEKLGVFIGSAWQGNIQINGEFGIYGVLKQPIENELYQQALPVALAEQVEPGPAQIFTVLEGETIQSFEIEIVKTMPNYKSSGKGMIIEVTDEALLNATGGIVQGMSGSPIVQNNRLVGAVTHVFVNDPTRGYACFAEWMLEEAGLAPL